MCHSIPFRFSPHPRGRRARRVGRNEWPPAARPDVPVPCVRDREGSTTTGSAGRAPARMTATLPRSHPPTAPPPFIFASSRPASLLPFLICDSLPSFLPPTRITAHPSKTFSISPSPSRTAVRVLPPRPPPPLVAPAPRRMGPSQAPPAHHQQQQQQQQQISFLRRRIPPPNGPLSLDSSHFFITMKDRLSPCSKNCTRLQDQQPPVRSYGP